LFYSYDIFLLLAFPIILLFYNDGHSLERYIFVKQKKSGTIAKSRRKHGSLLCVV